MAKEQENTMNYSIHDDRVIGEVQIADEVVAIIAGLAATEVKGVASMYGNITNELVAKLGMKNLSKGVKVDVPFIQLTTLDEHADAKKVTSGTVDE